MRIRRFIRLPTPLSVRVGQFCISDEEMNLRPKVHVEYGWWMSDRDSATATGLRGKMILLMCINLKQMTGDNRTEMGELLTKLTQGEERSSMEMMSLLLQLGFTARGICDYVMAYR
jgi:hypothetical protein